MKGSQGPYVSPDHTLKIIALIHIFQRLALLSQYCNFSFHFMSLVLSLSHHCWIGEAFIIRDSHNTLTEIHFKFSWTKEDVVNCINPLQVLLISLSASFAISSFNTLIWRKMVRLLNLGSATWLNLASRIQKEAWNGLCFWWRHGKHRPELVHWSQEGGWEKSGRAGRTI